MDWQLKVRANAARKSKAALGNVFARVSPQCRFDRMLFLMGHMRCGSTALSNVLCHHTQISGYGETHASYTSERDIGLMVLNQARRKSWRPRASYLFDKVLHSECDGRPPASFYESHAIFLYRRPEPSIRSLRKLADRNGLEQWGTDRQAAEYYEERMAQLLTHWFRFDPGHRVAIEFEELSSRIDNHLRMITAWLGLSAPLTNRYEANPVSHSRGAGDPVNAGKLDRIVPSSSVSTVQEGGAALRIDDAQRRRLDALYSTFAEVTGTARDA